MPTIHPETPWAVDHTAEHSAPKHHVVRTFICHHGGDFAEHIEPILRQVAPCGVRPWIDKRDLGDQVGLPLAQRLQEGMRQAGCSSLSLFLSRASIQRRWVQQELQWALQEVAKGYRVLPIWLDPPDTCELPPAFQDFLLRDKVLWLEPKSDPRFAEKYVRSVLGCAGIGPTTKTLTLFLGHRADTWEATVPPEFLPGPALDLRLHLDGHANFSPTEPEWPQIEAGLLQLRAATPHLERVNVCGQAPLGVGSLVGKIWDRSTGCHAPIVLSAWNTRTQQVWSTTARAWDEAIAPSPARTRLVTVEQPAAVGAASILAVLIGQASKEPYLPQIKAWNAARQTPRPMQIITLPQIVDSPAHAHALVVDCVAALGALRATFAGPIEIIATYPFAFAPLLAHHLRTLGPIHLYDEVKNEHTYRLVTVFP